MTNTIHSSNSVIQFKLRADTSGTDVNFIIVHIAVQMDLHAVSSTVQQTGTEIICSVLSTMFKENSLPVLTAKLISTWRRRVQSMVW